MSLKTVLNRSNDCYLIPSDYLILFTPIQLPLTPFLYGDSDQNPSFAAFNSSLEFTITFLVCFNSWPLKMLNSNVFIILNFNNELVYLSFCIPQRYIYAYTYTSIYLFIVMRCIHFVVLIIISTFV